MVDEVISAPVQVATTETAVPAAPITDTTPSVDSSPTVSTETAASVESAKTETPAESAKVEAPKVETLLAQDKKIEEKPVETKVEVKTEEKPVEQKVEEKSVEPPKYELKLPEGVQVDEAKFGDFTKMLGDFETTAKVPHDEVSKLGQQMLERHVAEMQRYTESLTQAWEKQSNDWKDSFLKSPEFANRTDTVLNSAIDAINIYGGDVKQQKEFRELMESSKIGNHPAMIRLLSNVMLAKAEPKPLAAPQIATPQSISKIQKMYGKKN